MSWLISAALVGAQTSIVPPTDCHRFSMFMPSSSDSAGSSDAEYSEGDVLELNTKDGDIVKEGFLMKKVIPVVTE